MTEQEMIKIVTKYPFRIREFPNAPLSVQLLAVREDGWLIQFIKDPCLEIQLEAVRQDGLAIQWIEDPCLELQLEAVREDIRAIYQIKDSSLSVQLAAVRKNVFAIQNIKEPYKKVLYESALTINSGKYFWFYFRYITNKL